VNVTEQEKLLERSAEEAAEAVGRTTEGSGQRPAPAEEEATREVVELAGQVKEALTPVRAPPAVRDRLRDEVVEVAQRRVCQDVRVESTNRRREWAFGAAIGSAMALIGWALHVLRSRMHKPSEPQSQSQTQTNS